MPVCIHTHICKYPYVYKKVHIYCIGKNQQIFIWEYAEVCVYICIFICILYVHIFLYIIGVSRLSCVVCACLYDLFFSLYTDISSVMKQYSNSNRASSTKNILSPSIKNEHIIALNLLFRSALLLRLLPCLFFG